MKNFDLFIATCCEKSKPRPSEPNANAFIKMISAISIAQNLLYPLSRSLHARSIISNIHLRSFQRNRSRVWNISRRKIPSSYLSNHFSPVPSRPVPSRQSNPNKTRHWHISERGTLKMKALRLPEAARLTARSPAGEILNLSLSKSAPRNFLKSWGRRSPNCSARFFNKGTIANKVAAAPTWRRDGWEEREIYSRGRIEFPRDCSRRWIAATDRERERERDIGSFTGSEYFNAARNLCPRRSSRKELK